MTDRPILFSGPMVRALFAGRKTQTRRIIDFAGVDKVMEFVRVAFDKHTRVPIYEMKDAAGQFLSRPKGKHFVDYHYAPRFAVGDRLWVRETWAPLDRLTHDDPGTQALADNGFYAADQGTVDGEITRWTPGIHMPRRASRLTLTVTEIRVQRLQEISAEDARDEGVERRSKSVRQMWLFGADQAERERIYLQACIWEFEHLWDSLNAARGHCWDANPWVVAITFTVGKHNIDDLSPKHP